MAGTQILPRCSTMPSTPTVTYRASRLALLEVPLPPEPQPKVAEPHTPCTDPGEPRASKLSSSLPSPPPLNLPLGLPLNLLSLALLENQAGDRTESAHFCPADSRGSDAASAQSTASDKLPWLQLATPSPPEPMDLAPALAELLRTLYEAHDDTVRRTVAECYAADATYDGSCVSVRGHEHVAAQFRALQLLCEVELRVHSSQNVGDACVCLRSSIRVWPRVPAALLPWLPWLPRRLLRLMRLEAQQRAAKGTGALGAAQEEPPNGGGARFDAPVDIELHTLYEMRDGRVHWHRDSLDLRSALDNVVGGAAACRMLGWATSELALRFGGATGKEKRRER